jgi:hypothetical protein
LVPLLECVIDYLRSAGHPGRRERGTFELLGDEIARSYAKRRLRGFRCGEKDRITLRIQSIKAKLGKKEAETKGKGTEGQDVASRADSVVNVGTEEKVGSSLAEVVFEGLRYLSPVVDEPSCYNVLKGP